MGLQQRTHLSYRRIPLYKNTEIFTFPLPGHYCNQVVSCSCTEIFCILYAINLSSHKENSFCLFYWFCETFFFFFFWPTYHVYPLLSTPESETARNITSLLLQQNADWELSWGNYIRIMYSSRKFKWIIAIALTLAAYHVLSWHYLLYFLTSFLSIFFSFFFLFIFHPLFSMY